MKTIKQYSIYSFLALLVISIPSVVVCKLYKSFTANKSITIGGKEYDILSKGIVCDGDGYCMDSFIAIGGINQDLLQAFESKKEELETADLPVCFSSGGGDAEVALGISKIIRELELATCVASKFIINGNPITFSSEANGITHYNVCLSACGFVFMSGKERFGLGSNFSIGIHEPAAQIDLCFFVIPIPFIDMTDNKNIAEIIANAFTKEDKAAFQKYYDLSLTVSSDDMLILNTEQQKDFRLFNYVPQSIGPTQ